MASPTTSKTNVSARQTGWHCPDCRHHNGELAEVCGGSLAAMVLKPNAKGTSLVAGMAKQKCQRRRM